MRRKLEIAMSALVLLGAFFFAKEGARLTQALKVEGSGACVVVDAGHGGSDPGKIGVNNEKEKDINLKIAKKLKELLEQAGVRVVMTRTEDKELAGQSSTNKKAEDMRNRCEIINQANPAFTVSIHQNSYPEEYVKGAQVFYFGQSKEGKELAETIQKKLAGQLDAENHREAKANESYFLLKKTESPTVIVECGFLSNQEEARLLATEEYQEKVAAAVRDGILERLEAK